MMRKFYLLFGIILYFTVDLAAQVTISSQDFEATPATPTITYTNTSGSISSGTNPATGVPVSANLFAGGTNGWEIAGGTSTLTFANQSLSGYTNCFVDLRLAGMSINAGNGIDVADQIIVSISVDGGTNYSNELSIIGSAANQRWDFTATGTTSIIYDGNNVASSITSSSGTGGISTATINIPNVNSQVRIRIQLLNNDVNERWVIDNIRIRGTATAAAPEINLQGNATTIADGDNTPALTDHTDFGSTCVAGGTVVRTFTIQNTGTADLNLTASSPYVAITGADAADFSITANPSTPIGAGSSTTFQITFNPSSDGVKNAILTIANNDGDEGIYDFAITGNGASLGIGTQPANITVTEPAAATFSVVATGPVASYQWQVYDGTAWVNITAVAPYSNFTTATLTISPTDASLDGVGYRCIVTGTSPCGNITSNSAILTITGGPCVTESFTNMPPNSTSYIARSWTGDNGSGWTATEARTDQSLNGRAICFNNSGTRVLTNLATGGIGFLSFSFVRGFTSTNSRTLQIWINGVQAGSDISVSTTSDVAQFYSGLINVNGTVVFEIRSVGSGQVIIDDVSWTCYTPACVPVQTITAFTPAEGPQGTLVTITGTNFSAADNVKFGGISASAVIFVNSTTIVAEVPSNAVSGQIAVTQSACDRLSTSSFTVLTVNANCGVAGVPATNGLIVSEVMDSYTGSLSYVEIFNPTVAGISLTNYTLRIATGTNTDYSLGTSTLASGGTFLVSIGDPSVSGSTVCGVTVDLAYPSGSGFNGNDQVVLRLSGADHDVVNNPGFPGSNPPPNSNIRGFSQLRLAGNTTPRTVYTPAEWTNADPESCNHLGISPAAVANRNITISTQPADVNCASTVVLSVTATGTPAINASGGYVWRYQAPGSTAWALASAFPAALGVTVTGSGTSSITITGNTANLRNYQFYVEISTSGSPGCLRYSTAVQYNYTSKLIYRSIGLTGNWSNPATWEMSDAVSGPYVAVCNYPNSLNCDEVVIQEGHTITLDIDNAVNKLTIQTNGGKLISTGNSTLEILNGNSAGADFIINGTYEDGANSANSIMFLSGATWSIAAGANLIKTSSSFASRYRDNYQGGIATIPASVNWTYRYTGTVLDFASSTYTAIMYYPNLILENSIAGTYASNINNTTPAFSDFTLTGNNNPLIIKGSMNVGGTGIGNIEFANINTNSLVTVNSNLTVKLGSTLTNGNSTHRGQGFDVLGNVTIEGTFKNNYKDSGLLRLSGGSAQSVNGDGIVILQDFTVTNTNTVTLTRLLGLHGVFTLSSSSTLNLNADLSLLSTATSTARVASVPPSTIINYGGGRFIVERYYPANRAWRLITLPLAETSGNLFEAWQLSGAYTPGKGIFVTGPNPDILVNGLDDSFYDNYSVKTFANNNYVNVVNTRAQPLSGGGISAANTGYFAFVRGDRSRTPDNTVFPNTNETTLSGRGKLQTGTQVFNLNNAAANPRFNLVGNPYASPIDFNAIIKTNINPNRFYVWDPTINQVGAFVVMEDNVTPGVFLPQTPSNVSSQRNSIQSSQAFFVELSNPTATLIFEEAHKSSSYNPAIFRPISPAGVSKGILKTSLFILPASGGSRLADGSLAEFRDDFNDTVDIQDAYKFGNINENLGFRRNGSLLAIERRPSIIVNDTLFYSLTKCVASNYQFEIESSNFSPLLFATLEDAFTGGKTQLNLAGKIVYDFTVSGDPESYAANRFKIVFKAGSSGPLPVTFTSVKAFEHNKNIRVQWTVAQELNISKYEVEKSYNGLNFSTINTTQALGGNQPVINYSFDDLDAFTGDNFYRIKSIDKNARIKYSSIVKVRLGKSSGITVYPNPVINNTIGLQFNNMAVGLYQLKLITIAGQLIYQSGINHGGGTSLETFSLPSTLTKGSYQLEITHPDKTKHTLKVIK